MAPGAWDRLAALAAADPERTAAVAGAERRTFASLVADAADLGRWLVAAGVAQAGRAVVVAVDGLELLVAVEGLLAIGAVPVVVDEALDADELHRVVDGTDAIAVLHRAASAKVVQRAVKRIQARWRPVCIDLGTRPAIAGDGRDTSASGQRPDAVPGTAVLVGPPPGSTERVARIDTAALGEVTVGDGAHLVLTSLARSAGLVSALATLDAGHALVLPSPTWTVDDVLAAVEQEHVTRATVDPPQRECGRAVANAFPHVGVVVITSTGNPAGTPTPDGAPARETIQLPGGTVDLAQVEARVASHRGVATCRVVSLATRSGPPALVGLVVVTDEHYLDAAELRAWARGKLAEHETPRAWLLVDALDPAAADEELRALAIQRLRLR